jgi:hypothetical protein
VVTAGDGIGDEEDCENQQLSIDENPDRKIAWEPLFCNVHSYSLRS